MSNGIFRKTTISIRGSDFLINGTPTYEGRSYNGVSVEGLLLNARMVQAIFDDLNPETRRLWDYPDGQWDAERNTREFVSAMPDWRAHGLLSFTVNLQGGSPFGYSDDLNRPQPWINSAFSADGDLRPDYMARLRLVLDRADELGMAPIVGFFYFGQDQLLRDEAALLHACDRATDWLIESGYRNILVEVNNQADIAALGLPHLRYDHDVLRPARVAELVERVQDRSRGRIGSPAGRFLVSTSFGGIPPKELVSHADFLLLHGNDLRGPNEVRRLIEQCRTAEGFRGQPILFNEDDHFDLNNPDNKMLAAIDSHASWGFFDYRLKGEEIAEGYQSLPVDWRINTTRKKTFFRLLRQVTRGG